MKALVIALATLLALPVLAQDFRIAPGDSVLAEHAERFVDNKRWGAMLLWGGLLVASLIIGFVRARNRRPRT